MSYLSLLLILLLTAAAAPCAAAPSSAQQKKETQARIAHREELQYQLLETKIAYGKATLADVRKALSITDVGKLSNIVLALYSMRWQRGVFVLLHNMWDLKQENLYPDLNWKEFAKPPVRLALATTLLRVDRFDNKRYADYLRAHEYDKNEFHRAQVVVGLGFNGEPKDIPYLYKMAAGDDPYVVQSAITALGLMELPPAKEALLKLHKKFGNDPRDKVIMNVLQKAYTNPPGKKTNDGGGDRPRP